MNRRNPQGSEWIPQGFLYIMYVGSVRLSVSVLINRRHYGLKCFTRRRKVIDRMILGHLPGSSYVKTHSGAVMLISLSNSFPERIAERTGAVRQDDHAVNVKTGWALAMRASTHARSSSDMGTNRRAIRIFSSSSSSEWIPTAAVAIS